VKISKNRLPALLIVFSFLLLVVPCSFAKDTWTRLQTKNFTVIGNASEHDMRKVAVHLEQFRKAVTLLLTKARFSDPVPTTVIVFKDDASYQPLKPKYNGKTRSHIAGYFLKGSDGNYITLTTPTREFDPFDVIFHEYFHFIVANNLTNAPLWLNEGLAEYYSTFETLDDDQKFRIGRAIGWHILELRDHSLLPLKTLLAVDEKSPYYNESGKTGIFYAESWALVHYLEIGNKEARQPQLMKFIDQLHTGMSLEENFRTSFQADYTQIEHELDDYIRKLTFPAIQYTLKERLNFEKEMQSAPLSDAEVQYYMGDLLLRTNRLDEAEGHLQKAIDLDPKLGAAQVSMGLLRLRQRHPDEAKQFFERAIASDPRNYLGYYYYANSLLREGKVEEAIKSLNQAVRLKPDAANIYTQLGYLYLNARRDKESDEAFKEAIRLDPNPYFFRSRGYAYLRLARGEAAVIDALTYLQMQGWRDTHAPYMVLVGYFGYRESGRDTGAAKIIDSALAKCDSAAWPYPIFKYLKHTITEEQLLAEATDNDKLTEAHAYLGLDLSLSGHRDEARAHLLWVKEKGNKRFVEYPLALAELNRLKGTAGDSIEEGTDNDQP